MRSHLRMMLVVAAAFAFVVMQALPLRAQGTSSLAGYVADPSGAVIPGATVTITNTATGIKRTTVTDAAGHYVISGLDVGVYNVTAKAKGFKSSVQEGMHIDVSAQAAENFKLAVGSSSESVTVQADAAHVQTETGAVSNVISGAQIQNIAVNGRNFVSLATLIPGASSQLPDQPGVGVTGGSAINFNGNRVGGNSWLVDGAQNRDVGNSNSLDTFPAMEAINQFRVQTSNYSAEYGTAGSAVITMAIKNGTNAFHGSGYEFLRNDAMDARNAFQTKKTPLKQNDFGWTLGGPIKKNKSFFFFSEEWRRTRQGTNINTHTISPQELAGDFSAAGEPGAGPTGTLKDPTGRGCVNGTQVDPKCFDPNAVALIKAGIFPAANNLVAGQFNNYNVSPSVPTNWRQEIVRIDHNLTPNLMLMGHWIHDAFDQGQATELWAGQAFPTIHSELIQPGNNAIVKLTQIVNPTLINEVGFDVSENAISIIQGGAFARPSGYNVPEVYPDNPQNRVPTIGFSQGYGGIDTASWPWINNNVVYTWHDTVTQTAGNHTFKYGGLYQYQIKNQQAFGNTQGNFHFDGHATGNAMADFLLGYPNSYNEVSTLRMGNYRYEQVEAFVQDDWKVRPNLTLNLGVRWFLMPHLYDKYNQLSTWLPTLYNRAAAPQLDPKGNIIPGTGNALDGIVQAGTNGVPRTLTNTYFGTVAPRLGFSWDPWSTGKTVIRGGFGEGFERVEGNDTYNVINNPPFVQSSSYTNPPFDNPAGGSVPPPSPYNIEVFNLNYKLPTTYQYSLGIQHQLAGQTILTVSYVGSHSSHLDRVINQNQATPIGAMSFDPTLNTGVSQNPYRPYYGLGNITTHVADASSAYNSLQVNLEKQMTSNLRFQTAYTWSKAEDNASSFGEQPQNIYNRAAEWGLSSFDRTQMLTINYIYKLPFFANQQTLAGNLLGGWTWAGVTTFQSGQPFSIGLDGGGHGLSSRANISGDITYPKTVAEWFNTSIFSDPAAGQFGNSGRNIVRGPGIDRWDMSLYKNFKVGERVNTELRFEFFNVFNNVIYNNPNGALGNGNFGKITSAHDPRILQAGLHFSF